MQVTIASIGSVAFVLMLNVSSAFWVLSVLAAQFYVLMYIMMFVAALRLRYSHAHIERMYRVPFGNVGIWVVSIVGIICCLFVFFSWIYSASSFGNWTNTALSNILNFRQYFTCFPTLDIKII